MTTDGNSLNDRQLALVHDTLEAVKLSEGIVHRPECNKAIGFAEIYAYATQPQHEPSAELLSALDGDVRVRRDFEALLRNVSVYWMPQVAAASSGEISTREIEGCRIEFRVSKAAADQIFVIIELVDKSAAPRNLFVCGKNGPVRRMDLPEARDGRVQLLLEVDSEIASGLRDVESEVFLR